MLPDNWHTLWTGDNGVSIQKSKTLLRGCNYRVRTLYARESMDDSRNEVRELLGYCPVRTWAEARSVVLSKPDSGTPPLTQPDMPRDEGTGERPIMYRPAS